MRNFFLLLSLTILVFSGCSKPEPVSTSSSKPSWILNPNQSGQTGAVGIAFRHYKGLAYQRQLAITRAVDELVMQTGVEITLKMNKKENVKNDKLNTILNVDTTYKAESKKLLAHIEEIWQDPSSDVLYLWLILDK